MWTGWLSLSNIDASNLIFSWSPTNSNMNVSSKMGSVEHYTTFVWNLLFKKLTLIERDSSLLTFTKSANAYPFTTETDK